MDKQANNQAHKESQAHILAEKVLFTPMNVSTMEKPAIMKGRIMPCDEHDKKDSKANPTKINALKTYTDFRERNVKAIFYFEPTQEIKCREQTDGEDKGKSTQVEDRA
jgi:hypothetical protein